MERTALTNAAGGADTTARRSASWPPQTRPAACASMTPPMVSTIPSRTSKEGQGVYVDTRPKLMMANRTVAVERIMRAAIARGIVGFL